MACGRPVITTHAGAELVHSPALGIITQRTPEAFEGAIEKALTQTWDRGVIIEYARSQSWDQVARRLSDVFSDVVSRHRSKRHG